MIALADHFEPSIVPENGMRRAPYEEQEHRVDFWCREYPRMAGAWRDSEGRPFVHTYFYPAEQYDHRLIQQLAEHCRAGWGEIEIHLHHGMFAPDTAENTRRQLVEFRDTLASDHGCLSYLDGVGLPRYAFVHGNFALANSAEGRFCGVDDEMQVLADTGCYADLTLPTASFHPAQIAKINSLYECALPLGQRAPHRRGQDLEVGRSPEIFPLMVQGPLMLDFSPSRSRKARIENGAITKRNPLSLARLAVVEESVDFSSWKAGLVIHQVALPRHGSDAARCCLRRAHAQLSARAGRGSGAERRDSSFCLGTRDGKHHAGGLRRTRRQSRGIQRLPSPAYPHDVSGVHVRQCPSSGEAIAMCGIAGVVNSEPGGVEAATIQRMCQSIVHRGPDDEGIFVKDGAGLGVRRLSVIDLAGGHQPVFNEDKTVCVVYNGEIYNFLELRGELEGRGHRFYTNTDTEVVVHLYEEMGRDCVQKLRGMFAFAIYDIRHRRLLLARDRLGIKPLHYALADGRLLFGSEIKSILAVAPELAIIDQRALWEYLYFGYIPDPATAFLSIHKLLPGHILEFERGKVSLHQYWDLPEYATHQPRGEEECLQELEQRLAEAVRIR